MKTPLRNTMKTQLAALALALSTIIHQPSTVFAQGSLTPSGAPAPTMKTLAQIEPRTPISAAPYTITNSGSYYLTTNLTVGSSNAITITANGVTLDLSGYTISSTDASAAGYGISLGSGLSDLTILNGHIRGGVTNNGSGTYSGSGFGSGIYYSGTAPRNTRVSGVSVAGCLNYGIYLSFSDSVAVESCTVRTAGSYGIIASTVKSCVAVDCGSIAIFGDQVSDSRGESYSGHGVFASAAGLNCFGSSTSGYGLYATTALNCYGYSSSSYGLYATTAQNCYGHSSSYYGLYATTAQNCQGSSSSGYGLFAEISASSCYGSSSSGYGLFANIAQNCRGSSSGNTGLAASTAQNCYGSTTSGNYGLHAAYSAIGCIGIGSQHGLYATYSAIGCYGYSSGTYGVGLYTAGGAQSCFGSCPNGTGLSAVNASFCTIIGGFGADIATGCSANSAISSINHKYNMP